MEFFLMASNIGSFREATHGENRRSSSTSAYFALMTLQFINKSFCYHRKVLDP